MSDDDFQQRSMRSMRSMNDAIDTAVRDMMHVDPRPGLRRRVLSKLEPPVRTRSWLPWLPWLLAPTGALAAAVLVVALLDDRTTSPAPVTTAMTSGATPPAAAPPPAAGIPERSRQAPAQAPRDQVGMPVDVFGPRTTRVSAASVRLPSADEQPGSTGEVSFALSAAHGGAGIPPALVILPLEIQPLQLPALLPRR